MLRRHNNVCVDVVLGYDVISLILVTAKVAQN